MPGFAVVGRICFNTRLTPPPLWHMLRESAGGILKKKIATFYSWGREHIVAPSLKSIGPIISQI
jgi:hypothetical protein